MNGHVAHPHGWHVRREHAERLGDQACRVGEVDQQRSGSQLTHILRDLEDYRYGAQGFGHTADAGGFLADQSVAPAEVFVFTACGHLPHAQLGGNIRRAFNGFLLIGTEYHFERVSLMGYHTPGKPSDDVQPGSVIIHQPEFRHRQGFQPGEESIDQFGSIGGTAANNCNFHISPFTINGIKYNRMTGAGQFLWV